MASAELRAWGARWACPANGEGADAPFGRQDGAPVGLECYADSLWSENGRHDRSAGWRSLFMESSDALASVGWL